MVLRPRPWLQRNAWVYAALLIVDLAAAAVAPHSPAQLEVRFAGVVVLGGLLGWGLARIRLVVTPDTVDVRAELPKRGSRSVLRAEVRSVHIYSDRVCLHGQAHVLLRWQRHWSVKQLTALSTELGVPLVTHRRRGQADAGQGMVLYQPRVAAWPR